MKFLQLFSIKLITMLAVLWCVNPSIAIPVHYDESISGDLSAPTSSVLQSFTLDAGINTVAGSLTFTNNDSVPVDFDGFIFKILPAFTLSSIVIETMLSPEGSGVFDFANWSLGESVFDPFQRVAIPGTTTMFPSLLPLNAGEYSLLARGLGGLLEEGDYRTAFYNISMQVDDAASVSEPGILALLIAALLGFGIINIRRKHSSH